MLVQERPVLKVCNPMAHSILNSKILILLVVLVIHLQHLPCIQMLYLVVAPVEVSKLHNRWHSSSNSR